MFWALEELADEGELDDTRGALARLAAWFHDAVYDARARRARTRRTARSSP